MGVQMSEGVGIAKSYKVLAVAGMKRVGIKGCEK